MKTQETYLEKLELINWISQLQDFSLLEQLSKLKKDNTVIPQWQKDEVLKRMKDYKNNPNSFLDFDDAMKDI